MKDYFDSIVQIFNWKIGKFSMLPIGLGLIMASLDVVMMTMAKLASKGDLSIGFALPIATLVYSVEPYIFFKSMKYQSLTAMNLIWDVTSDVLVTLVGVLYFKESINNLRWLAVVFAMFSLGLFAYTD